MRAGRKQTTPLPPNVRVGLRDRPGGPRGAPSGERLGPGRGAVGKDADVWPAEGAKGGAKVAVGDARRGGSRRDPAGADLGRRGVRGAELLAGGARLASAFKRLGREDAPAALRSRPAGAGDRALTAGRVTPAGCVQLGSPPATAPAAAADAARGRGVGPGVGNGSPLPTFKRLRGETRRVLCLLFA